jgi:hypothetical protein
MRDISDALELLTAQHKNIEELVSTVQRSLDAHVFDELADRLVAHLATEQELFYPVAAAAVSNDVLDEMLQEHVVMKRVLGELVWLGVDDPAFIGKLAELAELMTGHAGWQEEQLFQTVAEIMPADELVALGRQMQEHVEAFPIAFAA